REQSCWAGRPRQATSPTMSATAAAECRWAYPAASVSHNGRDVVRGDSASLGQLQDGRKKYFGDQYGLSPQAEQGTACPQTGRFCLQILTGAAKERMR